MSEVKVANNVYEMIRILRENRHRRMKMKELAARLGTGIRAITYYKESITKLGYHLNTYGGYNGGYQLAEEFLNKDELRKIESRVPDLYEKVKRINERI